MKICQSTLKFFGLLGITAQSHAFNMRNLLTILVFGIMLFIVGEFLFCEASGFKEYTESIYISSIILAIFVTFIFVIWNKENIFLFIDCFEKTAETSKYQFSSNCKRANFVDSVEWIKNISRIKKSSIESHLHKSQRFSE